MILPPDAEVRDLFALRYLNDDPEKQDDYNNMIDTIAQNLEDVQEFIGTVLNDPDFFSNPGEMERKIKQRLHEKKFKEKFKETVDENK